MYHIFIVRKTGSKSTAAILSFNIYTTSMYREKISQYDTQNNYININKFYQKEKITRKYCYIQWLISPRKYMGMGKRLIFHLEKFMHIHDIQHVIVQGLYEIKSFYDKMGFT